MALLQLTYRRLEIDRWVRWLPVPILLAGGVLRLSGLMTSPVWYDEAFTLYMTRSPLLSMVRLMGLDVNPPLWEIIVWPFVRIFGETLGIRIPALLASIASLVVAWLLIQRLIPTEQTYQRLGAALLISVLPITFWTAQDGRVYALLTLLYLLGTWLALSGRWWGMGACCALMVYAHNTGPFYALTVLAVALITHRESWRRTAWAGGLAAICYLPWTGQLFHSFSEVEYWLGGLSFDYLAGSLTQAFFAGSLSGPLMVLAGWVIMLSIILAAVLSLEPIANKDFTNPQLPMAIWAVGPLVLMIVVSTTLRNIIFYRPLCPLAIPLSIWFAAVLTPRRVTWTTWLIPYTWIVLLVAALVGWSPAIRGGDLESEAAFINDHLQPGDVIYHATGTSLLPFSFYTQPGYLLDENQNMGLLPVELQGPWGIRRRPLEEIPHRRAWIIWARDPIMSERAQQRMADYTAGATPIGVIRYWQAAPIEIYLREG